MRKRGALIAAVTKSRYMPPWHAAPGFGEFAGERRLTDEQIALIGAWGKAGMPQGDMAKLPALPHFTLEKPEATQRSDPEGAPDEPSAPHGAETAATQPGQTTQNDGLPYGVLSPFSSQYQHPLLPSK